MPSSKIMQARGQTPIEVIAIAVILVGLLLLVFVTTSGKNAETELALETAENSIQCNDMAAAIARLYSNRAITSETIALDFNARLRRVEGKPGSIDVGKISCSYIGSIKTEGGESDSDPGGTGTQGITLPAGLWCIRKA